MEKISIIVPIYNSEEYLDDCIKSIINQSYSNLEIILVNDKSTDNTENICLKYKQMDKRIKYYLLDKNKGVSYARNYGIDHSTSNYISFVDSDDMVKNDFIKVLYKNIKKYKADISEVNYCVIGKKEVMDNTIIKYNSDEMFRRLYQKGTGIRTVIVMNKLFKKSLFDKIKFDVNYLNEDEFIIHKLIYAAKNGIVTTNEILYFYRIRKNSMQRSFNEERIKTLEVFDDRDKYLKTSSLKELNKIAKIDTSIYYYALAYHFNLTKMAKKLYNIFNIEYQSINFRLSSYKKIKYHLFKCFPKIVSIITFLKWKI